MAKTKQRESSLNGSSSREPGPLRVLVVSSLFPNPLEPLAPPFNRLQCAALGRLCRLAVVAPVPAHRALRRGRLHFAPQEHPYPLHWPLFWYLPWVRRQGQGPCYLLSIRGLVRRICRRLHPQVLLATWAYPDGWAGVKLAQRLGLPVVLKVHGSDLNAIARDPRRQNLVSQALSGATRVLAVSDSLAQRARELGADPAKVRVLPNGVDQHLFRPQGRQEARRRLGLPVDEKLLLFVGRLTKVKGLDLALDALSQLPQGRLLVVGQGPEATKLRRQANKLGLSHRVVWLGQQDHPTVARFLAACDALVLPSRSEGDPNVALECLASGRPLAAAKVGSLPQLVQDGRQGYLFPAGDEAGLARAMSQVLNKFWAPLDLAAAVAGRSWQRNARELFELLQEISLSDERI